MSPVNHKGRWCWTSKLLMSCTLWERVSANTSVETTWHWTSLTTLVVMVYSWTLCISDARPVNFLCHTSYGKGSLPVPLWRQLGIEQVWQQFALVVMVYSLALCIDDNRPVNVLCYASYGKAKRPGWLAFKELGLYSELKQMYTWEGGLDDIAEVLQRHCFSTGGICPITPFWWTPVTAWPLKSPTCLRRTSKWSSIPRSVKNAWRMVCEETAHNNMHGKSRTTNYWKKKKVSLKKVILIKRYSLARVKLTVLYRHDKKHINIHFDKQNLKYWSLPLSPIKQ